MTTHKKNSKASWGGKGWLSRGSRVNNGPVPKWRVGHHHGAPKSPAPMCFTPEALDALLRSVGSLPPESGAKGFGPKDRMGFDLVEFDEGGTKRAGGAVYSPDVEWGEARRTFHLELPEERMRLWNGDLHSHPGGFGIPSRRSGPGLGDLGYVEEVFRANEWMQFFAIPILTFEYDGTVVINPWVCSRDDIHSPMIAEFLVCDVDEFPERPFNPEWLAAIGESEPDHVDDAEVASEAPAEVVFDVTVPKLTPEDAEVEVRGSHPRLGSWAGAGLVLQRVSDRRYTGSVSMNVGDTFQWKVTRGSWTTVEVRQDGRDTPNRDAVAGRGEPCVGEVPAWADAFRHQDDGSAATLNDAKVHHIDGEQRQGTVDPSSSRRTLHAEYTKRLKGLISEAFHEKTILSVGLGAGSYMVEKAVRLSPAVVKICDFDVVEVSNLARTSYTMEDVGLHKVEAFERRARAVNPLVQVKSYTRSFTEMTKGELDELFDSVDLVVGGTDNFEAQALVNEEAVRRGIPAVFIGIHARGDGGRVVWSVPRETGCYRCVAPERYEAAEAATGPNDDLNLDGMVGTLIDCQFIDMVALKVAVAILERGQASHYGRFYGRMKGRNDIVVRTHPEYKWGEQLWDALLADLPSTPKDFARELKEEALFSMDTAWLKGRRDPGCSVCGKSKAKGQAVAAYEKNQASTSDGR